MLLHDWRTRTGFSFFTIFARISVGFLGKQHPLNEDPHPPDPTRIPPPPPILISKGLNISYHILYNLEQNLLLTKQRRT